MVNRHNSLFTFHSSRFTLRASRARRAGRALALCAFLLSAGPARRAPATCRCGSGSLEVVLVLDTTSSMGVMIGTVKEQLFRLVAALEGSAERLRVGAVVYRTAEGPEYTTRSFGLSGDRKALAAWIRKARARGGGYEAVEKGLEAAVTGMEWTKGARKVIILVGDEGPHPRNRERCLKLARLAKSRGISVSAVTCSDTAWRYWQLVNSEKWKKRLRTLGSAAKTEFQLPVFQEIAKNGGGMAVSAFKTRELLKWLLAIASGAGEIKDKEVEEFMAWDPTKRDKAAGRSPMLAQLRYRGGWATARNFEALRAALGQKVDLDFDSPREVVAASDPKLRERPLLYVTGHGKPGFSAKEKAALKEYLSAGGLLWADCCCGRKEFDASLRALLAELFPGKKLAPLDAKHPVYRAGYVVKDVRYADRPRTRGTAFTKRPPRLEGLYVKKRLAVIYSRDSLGCGWASYPLGAACQVADEDALKLSINILLYALTR